MFRLAVAMTCAPRPELYLHQSLGSFRQAGFTQRVHLFAEPNTPQPYDAGDWVWHMNPFKLGCFPNWRQGLSRLLQLEADADWLLMMQDDALWRQDAAAQMEKACTTPGMAKVGFLSPYTSKAMVPKSGDPQGWVDAKFHNKAFWGAVALCFPRGAAEALCGHSRFANHNHHRKLDVIVGNSFVDLGRAMKVHVPSLVDHIGRISSIGRHKIKGTQWARRGYQYRSTPP